MASTPARRIGAKAMAGGEEETRLHIPGEGEDDLCSLPQLLRNVSFASSGDDSLRSSSASAGDASFGSCFSHAEFYDEAAMYRLVQSEYEEIPSFRWIASPLRWWGTRRTRDVSFRTSVASSAGGESGDGDVRYQWTRPESRDFLSFRWMATPMRIWRARNRADQIAKLAAAGRQTSREMVQLDRLPEGLRTSMEWLKQTRREIVQLDRLPDRVRMSMEFLGEGTFGASYKAGLQDGSQAAVKRLRGETAGEFEAQVTLLGKVRHPNLLAPTAYYSTQDEKLLLFDYMPKGNLSAFLQARSPDNPIDWGARMKIAIAITWALHHLHSTHEEVVHGNLTSRNVLLDDHGCAVVTDYGLYRLMTPAANSTIIAAAGSWASHYRAPELSTLEEANTKTDVYSLGVILLELLTGKSPAEAEAAGGLDLPQWVTSTIKEGRSIEVFDRELRERRAEDLLYALNVALHCVDPSPDARPGVVEVLHQLSEINAYMLWERSRRPVIASS